MSGIHDGILTKVQDELQEAMIDAIEPADATRVGVVKLGPLQGDPDPDDARISLTIHENDPDKFITGSVTGMSGDWSDEVLFVEIGGATTWRRKFTVKCRCILEETQEDLLTAREVASTVRHRLERSLANISFNGLQVGDERVARGIVSSQLKGEMLQSGGPPDSYDYFIKFRFDLLTTTKESVT
jgi:hypothetical protein